MKNNKRGIYYLRIVLSVGRSEKKVIMEKNKKSHGFYQVGALLAVMVLVFAGCSNPAGSSNASSQQTSQEIVTALLEGFLGCEITSNGDATFTVDNFDGTIPVPNWDTLAPDLQNQLQGLLADGDQPRLDLHKLESGESVTLPVLGQDFTITNQDGKFSIDLPGGFEYVLIQDGAFWTIKPTDRQYLNDYIGAFTGNLAARGYDDNGDGTWTHVSVLGYYETEITLPLPDFPSGLTVSVNLNGVQFGEGEFNDNPGALPVAVGENTIVVTTKLGEEDPVVRTILVSREAFVPVMGMTLNLSEVTLSIGGEPEDAACTLTAEYEPADATNPKFDWTSSDEDVAVVDENGVVTAVSRGNAVITATTVDTSIEQGYEAVTGTVNVSVLSGDNSFKTFTVNERDVNNPVDPNFNTSFGNSVESVTVVFEINDPLTAIAWKKVSGFTSLDVPGNNPSGSFDGDLQVGDNKLFVTLTAENGKSKDYTLTVYRAKEDDILVEGVSLNKETLTLAKNSTEKLFAAIEPADATNQAVTWASSDETVAAVRSDGMVTALKAGTATITASTVEGGKKADCFVTVTVPAAGVSIDKSVLTLNAGETAKLSATVSPADVTNSAVFWASDNPAVSVDQSGNVTAQAVGGATITVTTVDGGYTAICAVTVNNIAPIGVTLNTYTLTLSKGESQTIVATVSPGNATNKDVTWSSSDTNVATVQNGEVTGVGVGSADIIATSAADSTIKVTCKVAVIVRVNNITLNKDTLGLIVGDTEKLTAEVNPADASNPKVIWASDSDAASVDQNGNVTALKAGAARITVTALDGSGTSDTCTVTVTTIAVTGVALNKADLTLPVNGSEAILATVSPGNATNKDVIWSSSDTNVATVSNGVVTAVAEGSATITVSTVDGDKTATCGVTVIAVTVPVAGVTINEPATRSVTVGGSITLTPAVSPANATIKAVTWASDGAAASVDSSGKVTGLAVGSATITVTTVDGNNMAQCVITVTPLSVNTVSITPAITLALGGNTVLVPTIDPPNASDKTVGWGSDNNAVATVDPSGKVTAGTVGSATITVTTHDGNKTAQCFVTVVEATVRVTAVTPVAPTARTLNVGDTPLSLGFSIVPSDATIQAVTWSSDNTAVAVVDSGGKVTAIGAGSADITAKTVDGGFEARYTITVPKVIVKTLDLVNTSVTLPIGGTQKLIPILTPANATDQSVTWTSDNTAVVTVDSDGNITAKAAGTAVITGTTKDGSNKTAACAVTVPEVPVSVTGVTLSPTALTVTAGETSNSLEATVVPSDATNKGITWDSANPAIASVGSTGKVTAVSAGTVTITVTTADGGKTATCTVTVNAANVAVTDVFLNKTSLNLLVNDSETLSASVQPAVATNKNVAWSSSDTSVATVNNGLVKAVNAGTAAITVTTADGGKTASCAVTVTAPVTGVIRNVAEAQTLKVGGTTILSVTVQPDNATPRTVTWSSSNSSVASVDSGGNVKAQGVGSATITATSVADTTKLITFTITVDPVPVTGVSLVSPLTLPLGGSQQLFPMFEPSDATDQTVTWTSSDDTIASVAGGVVTAGNAGTATITVTAVGGATGTCVVTVTPISIPVIGVSLNKPSLSVNVGATDATLQPTVSPSNATIQTVSWSTSNAAVAAVDSYGKVTGIAKGTASIIATTADGQKTASCDVTVNAVSVTGLSLNASALTLPNSGTIKLIPIFTPANATDQSVTWTSSNTAVATVDTDGLVTAKGGGNTTITVTSNVNTTAKATCTITVEGVTIPVTGVTLNQTTHNLTVGDSYQLTATIAPSNASVKTVTWDSTNPAVASVDSSGKVMAHAVGTATITVTTVDGGKTETCAVTVNAATVAVTGVILNRNTLSLTEGGTETLFALVQPTDATNKAVTWTSGNTGVVTVAGSIDTATGLPIGTLTAVKAGTTNITVKTNNGNYTALCAVTVSAPTPGTVAVIGVTLNQTTHNLTVGDSYQLTATIAPNNATNQSVFWSSSDSAVATVSDGLVTAVMKGTATITATTGDGGKTASCTVTVDDNTTITFVWTEAGTSLTANPSTAIIHRGEQATITAPPGLTYQWYVEGDAVAGATSQDFVFDSAKWGPAAKPYQVSVMVTDPVTGKIVGGNDIAITVIE